ncbi:hypothetical protein KBK19_05695 [Microvirga sp. STR05]|uniref:SHOCT domain-containing protein n=1 Tax=Hymenobacter duratus TaxID=2771356 RepID=A0ABR8JGJ6_9BACT|nr:SHOCT domain-containing protein [Hymenobacter duratus]MBD2714520.1 hypothetical protein [Hymenobacter duratus]MBR7949423.1 hypothetical protein [Microvirga sp. STR05]
MEKDPSPLDTLRQLKEWLDAGTITPQEFATLKQKLLFSEAGSAPTSPAAAPEPTTIAPVEDPMLPPVVHHTPLESLPPVGAPSVPASPAEPMSRPIIAGRPEASPSAAESEPYSAAATTDTDEVEDAPYTAPPKSPLGTILIIGGIVALLALVAYLMLGNRESERLTSTSRTAADSLAVTPDVGPQAEQIELPPAAVPETVRVAPVLPPVAPQDSVAATPAPAAPTETPAAADEAGSEARVQRTLEGYYADLQAAPFSAAQHFAPNVERFYTLSGTTPQAIEAELARTHFPEFTEASTQIEPGSLKVGPVANDGSRLVTYLEKSQAFRQSLQKHQQTTAQVRVRLDKNFKIVYLRQEKLLENTFTD